MYVFVCVCVSVCVCCRELRFEMGWRFFFLVSLCVREKRTFFGLYTVTLDQVYFAIFRRHTSSCGWNERTENKNNTRTFSNYTTTTFFSSFDSPHTPQQTKKTNFRLSIKSNDSHKNMEQPFKKIFCLTHHPIQ